MPFFSIPTKALWFQKRKESTFNNYLDWCESSSACLHS